MTLPTVEEALARMIPAARPFPSESVPLVEADGRWLAEDVTAVRDQPPFDASAMDGWAIRAVDAQAGAKLQIVGESLAGHAPTGGVGPGEAMRIFTGAALPPGADLVVIQEKAARIEDRVVLDAQPMSSSSNVRHRGCDFRCGGTLLTAGERLNPWRIALAAAAGIERLVCRPRPRIALLATGDELVAPGQLAGPNQIYDSCTPALSAFVKRHAAAAIPLGMVADSEAATAKAVDEARFDLLVTIGGASVGDRDLVKPAVRGLGGTLIVEGVQMRPGKPIWFATLADGRLVLGLPGNPASALVCAEIFLAPLLAVLQGGSLGERLAVGVLTEDLPANGPRDHYLRATGRRGADGRLHVTAFADQDSSLVSVMAAANLLVRRKPFAPAAKKGENVDVLSPLIDIPAGITAAEAQHGGR